jgi:hypothetical protein
MNVVINTMPFRVRPASTVGEARSWMNTFVSIFHGRRSRERKFWGPLGISDVVLAKEYKLGAWQRDEEVDIEKRRRVTSILDKMQRFGSDPECPVANLGARGVEATVFGAVVIEALATAVLDGLCVSLGPPGQWSGPWVPATLRHTAGGSSSQQFCVKIRHAANRDDLDPHRTWLGENAERTLELFRRTVSPFFARHVAASSYRKHVRGKTDAQRRENARNGDGQYVSTADDAAIQAWEFEALVGAWCGEARVKVEVAGGAYHVYYERHETVGYEGGTGADTRWMRVEWASGAVHSHPRSP